jgi:hypothetical protein
MTSTVQRRIAAISGFILFSLAAFVLLVSTAQAAQPLTQLQRAPGGAKVTYAPAPPTQLQRARDGVTVTNVAAGPAGRSVGAGRGRAFITVRPARASTAGVIGGLAVTAFVIALVAFLALGRRASRRGELAPVTSLVQATSESPATRYEDQERKAA